MDDWDSTDSSPSELREVIRIFYNFLWYSTKRYRYFLYPSALPPQECRACWSQTPSRDPGVYIVLAGLKHHLETQAFTLCLLVSNTISRPRRLHQSPLCDRRRSWKISGNNIPADLVNNCYYNIQVHTCGGS